MKRIAYCLFFVVVLLPASLYAKDTVYVASDTEGEGSLNNAFLAVYNADPTGAQLSNTVFKLEHYGYYILTSSLNAPLGSHLTIVGPEPGNTQETSLPQIVWSNDGNVTTTFNLVVPGDITLKNIWFMSARTVGTRASSSIVIQNDSLRNLTGAGQYLWMDGCIVDYHGIGNGGGAIEPSCKNFRGRITNTYFRNMADPHYRYYGRPVSWTYGSTEWHTDTLIFENCTIANAGYGYMQEAPCYGDYVSFNHCTFLNTMMFTIQSTFWWNLSVTNCLFANAYLFGHIPTGDAANAFGAGGVVNIDSTSTFGFTVPFTDNKTADPLMQRHILIANNSYGHQQWYIDYLNNNPYMPDTVSQRIHRMPAMNGKTYRFLTGTTDGVKNFPYMNIANMYPALDTIHTLPATYDASTDPQFLLDPTNRDSIKAFLLGRWFDGKDVEWTFNPQEDIQQVWPMSENLSYTNTTLKTAAMSGYPLGDLYHWWPTEYASWKGQQDAEHANITNMLTNGLTSVKEIPSSTLPVEYTLKQNYPNPFNPTTQIEYSVPKNGFVSLKVYNELGQEVATLFSGVQNAGSYVVNFDGSALSSGVYLYRLQSENVSLTKKLVLMK